MYTQPIELPTLRDSSDSAAMYRIRRLVNPIDEMRDLTPDQRKQALEQTVLKHQDNPEASRHRDVPTRPSGPDIRQTRDPADGLLLLYPLQQCDAEGLPFVGFAASFPKADTDTPIDYVVNSVYWKEEIES